MKVLTLQLDADLYAVDLVLVREVIELLTDTNTESRATKITPVPRTSADLWGVINLRGYVIPVSDLRQKLGMERVEPTVQSRIVILDGSYRAEGERDDVATWIGVVVDSVHEVVELDESNINEPPPSGMKRACLQGVGKYNATTLLILDVDSLLYAHPQDVGKNKPAETKRVVLPPMPSAFADQREPGVKPVGVVNKSAVPVLSDAVPARVPQVLAEESPVAVVEPAAGDPVTATEVLQEDTGEGSVWGLWDVAEIIESAVEETVAAEETMVTGILPDVILLAGTTAEEEPSAVVAPDAADEVLAVEPVVPASLAAEEEELSAAVVPDAAPEAEVAEPVVLAGLAAEEEASAAVVPDAAPEAEVAEPIVLAGLAAEEEEEASAAVVPDAAPEAEVAEPIVLASIAAEEEASAAVVPDAEAAALVAEPIVLASTEVAEELVVVPDTVDEGIELILEETAEPVMILPPAAAAELAVAVVPDTVDEGIELILEETAEPVMIKTAVAEAELAIAVVPDVVDEGMELVLEEAAEPIVLAAELAVEAVVADVVAEGIELVLEEAAELVMIKTPVAAEERAVEADVPDVPDVVTEEVERVLEEAAELVMIKTPVAAAEHVVEVVPDAVAEAAALAAPEETEPVIVQVDDIMEGRPTVAPAPKNVVRDFQSIFKDLLPTATLVREHVVRDPDQIKLDRPDKPKKGKKKADGSGKEDKR
ncbi:MAG: chemotaxis protein CheW [Magnetococcales bacterium]|nr:chemotaxis protein CheW [Magnetococcales bacterium]